MRKALLTYNHYKTKHISVGQHCKFVWKLEDKQ